MKPYGLPRVRDIEFPDVADIQKYGLKSSAGRCFKENGEYKSYIRNSRHRKQIRRKWKKKARASVKYSELDIKDIE